MSALRAWRRPIVALVALVALAALAGCAGASAESSDVPSRAPPPRPAWLPGHVSADGADSIAPGAESAFATSPLFARTVPPDPLAGPLADPRLVAARELRALGKRLEAARAVDAFVQQATTPRFASTPDAATVARLRLISATLRRDGGDPMGAVDAYERVAGASPILAPAARTEIAALEIAQGKHASALARLEAIAPASRTSDRFRLLHAEAAIRAGDAQEGARDLDAFLSRSRRPPGSLTAALRVASALLVKPGADRAALAARAARRIVGLATGSIASEAYALEKRALDTLPRDKRAAVAGSSLAEKIETARAKLRSKDARAAVTLLDRLMKAEGKKAIGDDACALHRVRGEALGEVKRKAESADAHGFAIEACRTQPDYVDVVFAAAKASARAERAAEAEARFARVEKEFPTSRFADDARVERVRAALDRNDVPAAAVLAGNAAATYPSGDVVFDAVFLIAQQDMVAGRWDRARDSLTTVQDAARRERSYLRAGRFDYFLGRARQELGDAAGARAAYRDVVIRRAATYYGALAYARLEEMERGAGALALAFAKQRASAAPPLPDPSAEELSSDVLRRALDLAVAGDVAGAEAELSGQAEGSTPPSPGLRWWLARLVAPSDPVRASSLLRNVSENEATPGEADFDAWLTAGPFGGATAAWQLAYPRPFASEVATASTETGVGEPLILSIMREESAFSPTALSKSGARGLLQLMPGTARTIARPLGLPFDDDALQKPEINTRLGARFLGQLRRRFPHQPLLAVPSYNAGPLAVVRWCDERPSLDFDLWVETIPYRETRLYTKRVLGSLAAYDLLGSPGPRGEIFFTPRRACVAPETDGSEDRPDEPAREPGASSR